MANFVTLTPLPVTISLSEKGHAAQPSWCVLNTMGYDVLDLQLGVLFLSPKVTAKISIETSMQNQSDYHGSGQAESEWQLVGQFPMDIVGSPNTVPGPQWQKLRIGGGANSNGLLRFVRWRVDLNGAGTATFFIRGLGRRRSS